MAVLKYNDCVAYINRVKAKIKKNENVEINVSFHSFRHKLTKELLDSKKIDPNVVKKILGHKNLSTVMDIYHEITEDEYINQIKEYYDGTDEIKL